VHADDKPIDVAVVTGGHCFDVRDFHRLFRGLEGIDAYIQHTDDFASAPEDVRDSYDVVLFYIMLPGIPTDDGLPWYAGKPETALSHLGETNQGIFVLHHAILAYLEWDFWADLVGVGDRKFGFDVNQRIHVHVENPEHPITRGLSNWEMVDETYTMADPGEGSETLLTVDHPKSMNTIAWTRQFRNARVFCLQSGHDIQTFTEANFRSVVRRGIQWCAGRI